MGLSQALYSGISGLTNHQVRMDNVGNNLANVNTVGFKKGVHQFNTLFSQTIRGGTAGEGERGAINPIQMGLGANTSSINQDFSQGGLQVTGNERDMAIEGNGFFVLDTGIAGTWGRSYTRDGTFYLGQDGRLLYGEGLRVMGVQADEGQIPEAANPGTLTIPIGETGAARETSEVAMTGNMNSDVDVAVPNVVTTRAVAPVADTDSTWVTGTAGNDLNLGHVQTSAGLYDSGAGAPATMGTDLANLQFLRGTALVTPFNGISTGETISIEWEKGGREMSATFTYGENDPAVTAPNPIAGDGTTVNDLMTFLCGGVNDDGVAVSDQRLRGGAMGTIHTRQRQEAVDGYDAIPEHAGAFLRQYVGGVNPHDGAVDYDNDGVKDATSRVSIGSNLGSENAITNIEFSYGQVNYTDIFSEDSDLGTIAGGSTTTNLVVYDSLGNPKDITMQMSLVGRDTNFSTWRWIADSTDDTDATWLYKDRQGNQIFNPEDNPGTSTPQTSINVGTGLIRFDTEGNYVRGVELSSTSGIEVDLDDKGVNEPLSVDITEGLSADQDQDLDFANLTSVAAANDFNLREQNGSPPGTLDSFTVTSDGVINGVFSNGVLEVLGQLVLGIVPNENGLIQIGSNQYVEGPASGEPQIGFPTAGGRGQIRSGSLEQSNVEISEEFTNLIVTQRGFQANTRVISTSDEMLVELVNLKR